MSDSQKSPEMQFWHNYSMLTAVLEDGPIRDLVHVLVSDRPELANDLYFALEDKFLNRAN